MLPEARQTFGAARRVALVGVALTCLGLPGCYLLQASVGQLELISAREPIAEVIARPDTPQPLRERLDYVSRARRFAADSLGLPDNGSFTGYVALNRPYVVWNVFAAPEFSVEPRSWCFPIAGCVAYRGYFKEADARDYASRLEREGDDVYVAPVAAYSTLGHFDDPVLSTMLAYGDVELAGLIFHELAHQVVYVAGDSAFNEAFATTVELEGVRRWLASLDRPQDLESFRRSRARAESVVSLMVATRQRLERLYASGLPPDRMRQAKAEEFERLRADFDALRAHWPAGVNLERALGAPLNNARLVAVATYEECVPGFTRMLTEAGGDLPRFYREVKSISRKPAEERSALLCRPDSAPGAAPEQVVAAATAFQSQVAGHDGAHAVGFDPEAHETVDGADAVHAQ
jgi:predicted aminopeptidase